MPAARALDGAPTQLLPTHPPRSALARAAIPLAILFLAVGIGLGALLGSREDRSPAPPMPAPTVAPVAVEEPVPTVEPSVPTSEPELAIEDGATDPSEPAAPERRRRPARNATQSETPPEEESSTARPGMLLGADRFPEGR